nr:MAG TPA: hypothetical protein [Caudoviricetes sp.]
MKEVIIWPVRDSRSSLSSLKEISISEIDHFCVGLRNRAEKNGNRPI